MCASLIEKGGVKVKKVRIPEKNTSMIGKIIDMPFDMFKEELERQKVNIGTMSNLILNLEAMYFQCRQRKDGVLDLVYKGKKKENDPEIQKSMNGLYAEMTKLEKKIVYLKKRVKELANVDSNT
jgi:hypothetical protein